MGTTLQKNAETPEGGLVDRRKALERRGLLAGMRS